MELSLTTFILEIANFLILVWILKRLFFAPVKKAIEARRAEIRKTLDDAEAVNSAALTLRSQYENRLKEWETQKDSRLSDLKNKLETERDLRLKAIESDFRKERERLHAKESAAQAERKTLQEQQAIQQSLFFLTKLLSALSSKEIEIALIQLFLDKIRTDARIQSFLSQKIFPPAERQAIVRTAYELSDENRARIVQMLSPDGQTIIRIETDPSLIAGMEVSFGNTILRANLRDELKFFATNQRGEQIDAS